MIDDKKLNNYQKIIAKNYKKIANQKKEITRLSNALNMANGTVANQIDVIKRINDDIGCIYRSIDYKDSEIRRLNELSDSWYYEATKEKTIREYLESKLFKGKEDE